MITAIAALKVNAIIGEAIKTVSLKGLEPKQLDTPVSLPANGRLILNTAERIHEVSRMFACERNGGGGA